MVVSLLKKTEQQHVPRPLQRSRAGAVFSEDAGRLCEQTRLTAPLHKRSGEFLPAPKKPFLRGKPKAKLRGALSFAYFSLTAS
ncbi:MAG: hypothetical protein SWH68_16520, partial [Thermodesulfobacteriota bacterium]|nr:hypothetical protein [Thermodesulfobacteriota bacterium]